MPPPPRDDPYPRCNFRVEIQGITIAAFSECSGLASETDVIEYRSGGDAITRKLPGLRKFTNIVFRRGVTKNRELWDWYKAVLDGNVQRKTGAIVLLDESGQEVLRWKFRQAWPRKYEAPAFDAAASEVAIETLEITHEGLELA